MQALIVVLIAVIGLAVGSFLNICIYRIPRGESVLSLPSHCIDCGARLKPADLLPLVSFALLGGKCRYCKSRISLRYPLVELMTAAAFTALYAKYGLSAELIFFGFLMSVLIVVFFIDTDFRIIPDKLVIAGLIGGGILFIYNLFLPFGIYGDRNWWTPLLGILPGSGFLFIVALIGFMIYKSDDAMGMGDVKLFAPIGIFLGWRMAAVAVFLSVFAGGLAGLLLMILRFKKRKDTIPFGPFIVVGTFTAIMWGSNILKWYFGNS